MLDLLMQDSIQENNIFYDNSLLEESYFSKSLQFVTEMKNEYRNSTKKLYKTIAESANDTYVINESFADFFEGIKNIIDKFIKFIRSLVERFITFLHKLVGSDKYIKAHKDDIKLFDGTEKDISLDLYEFTISPVVPVDSTSENEFNKIFTDIDNALEPADVNTAAKIKEALDKVYKDLDSELNDNWADKFRAKIIGKENGSIDQSDFASELFELFRNGSDTKDSTDLTSTIVNKAYYEFDSYSKDVKEVTKQKNNTEKEYRNIEKSIKSMIYVNKSGSTKDIKISGPAKETNITSANTTSEAITTLDLIIKAKSNQVMEMSSIYAMVFGAKLDALKDRHKQNKEVLYKALDIVQKYHKERVRK